MEIVGICVFLFLPWFGRRHVLHALSAIGVIVGLFCVCYYLLSSVMLYRRIQARARGLPVANSPRKDDAFAVPSVQFLLHRFLSKLAASDDRRAFLRLPSRQEHAHQPRGLHRCCHLHRLSDP